MEETDGLRPKISKEERASLRKFCGLYLARLRHDAGLTQWALANSLGIRRCNSVSAYENGYYAMPPRYITEFCRVTGADVRETAKMILLGHKPDAFRMMFPDEWDTVRTKMKL